MIQRIQSLFLLLAVIATGLLLTQPMANIFTDSANILLKSNGFVNGSGELVQDTLPLLLLIIGILFLTVVDIFLFKKRVLQIRICIYTILLNLGLIGMVILEISGFKDTIEIESISYTYVAALPIINVILLFLAFRGIRKDEVLVKAYDRLR